MSDCRSWIDLNDISEQRRDLLQRLGFLVGDHPDAGRWVFVPIPDSEFIYQHHVASPAEIEQYSRARAEAGIVGREGVLAARVTDAGASG